MSTLSSLPPPPLDADFYKRLARGTLKGQQELTTINNLATAITSSNPHPPSTTSLPSASRSAELDPFPSPALLPSLSTPPIGIRTAVYDPALTGDFDPVGNHSEAQQQKSLGPLLSAASTDYATGLSSNGEILVRDSDMIIDGAGEVEIEIKTKGKGKGKGKRLRSTEETSPTDLDGKMVGGSGDEAGSKVKNTKRAAQNRAAQQAFRQRKEQYVKDLESKATLIEATQAKLEAAEAREQDLLQRVLNYTSDRVSWELERKAMEEEREKFKKKEVEWVKEIEELRKKVGECETKHGQVK